MNSDNKNRHSFKDPQFPLKAVPQPLTATFTSYSLQFFEQETYLKIEDFTIKPAYP